MILQVPPFKDVYCTNSRFGYQSVTQSQCDSDSNTVPLDHQIKGRNLALLFFTTDTMASAFFYGTLMHPKILKRILDNDANHLQICPAILTVSP